MQNWEVTYSTGNSTTTQWLKMVVNAISSIQATRMVESMNGGTGNCRVHFAYLV